MTKDEQIEHLKEQVKLYRFDWLTGLKGRRDFDYDLRKKFKSHTFYLCYYDVDNLHKVNREQGFAEGDKLIRQVAGDIQRQVVPHTTYRTSGDEFYTICCGKPTDEVDHATMVSITTDNVNKISVLLGVLDDLMIGAKTRNKTRRVED